MHIVPWYLKEKLKSENGTFPVSSFWTIYSGLKEDFSYFKNYISPCTPWKTSDCSYCSHRFQHNVPFGKFENLPDILSHTSPLANQISWKTPQVKSRFSLSYTLNVRSTFLTKPIMNIRVIFSTNWYRQCEEQRLLLSGVQPMRWTDVKLPNQWHFRGSHTHGSIWKHTCPWFTVISIFV